MLLSPTSAAQTPAPAPVSQAEDNSTVIIFAIAFVVLFAVGGGAFWLGKQTQPAPEPLVSPQRKRRGSGRGAAGGKGWPSPTRGDRGALLLSVRCRPAPRFRILSQVWRRGERIERVA